FKKEEEIKRINKLINSSRYFSGKEDVEAMQEEFIQYLKDKKRKILKGENVKEIEINYSKCKLEIKWKENNEDKYVNLSVEDVKELLFPNLELKIERF
ncbi:MAG: hypothetical protein JHC31_06830, partial [Sulfurihydrogenibium sp.]|nr:hypothetical protein [Sulfurihydrogenibium sp.]